MHHLTKWQTVCRLAAFAAGLLLCPYLPGQSIALSSMPSNPGGTVVLGLSLLDPTSVPAGLEWTLAWPANQISAVTVGPGLAAAIAGKSISCAPATSSITCLVAGLNTNGIGAGVVANIQVTLTSTASTVPISVVNPVGADATATALPSLDGAGGVISVPALSSVACSGISLPVVGSLSCTVTLNQAAPPGGTTVVVSGDHNGILGLPASVTVAGGTSMASFSAAVLTPFTGNETAHITATLGSSTQTVAIGLPAPSLSRLVCDPPSLGQSASSVCTVTLSEPAPGGGTSVATASNNSLLSVPPSVNVPAGTTTATFLAAAASSIPGNQNATVTATLGNSSETAAISLVAPTLISSLNCSPATLLSGATANCTVSLNQAFPGVSLVHVTSCAAQSFPGTTCSIPPAGSGNLIVVGWQTGSGANPDITINGITDNAGNTYAEAGPAFAVDTGGGSSADIWYAANSSPGATVLTITPSDTVTNARVVIWEFAGADLYNPVDQTAILNNWPAAAVASGAPITTANSGDVVISLAATSGVVTGISSGNSFVNDPAANAGGWAHLVASSTGTYEAQWDQSPAGSYAASTVAFRAATNIQLTSNNPALTVPSLAMVSPGAATAAFNAGSLAVVGNQTATITASLGGSSQTAGIALIAPVVQVSRLTCPAGLLSGMSVSCSITLSQAVSTDTTVSLSSNSIFLSVPQSVTIPAGSVTASVTATAGTILLNSQAVATATLGASSQSSTVSLWTTPVLTSLVCTPTRIPLRSTAGCTVSLSQATVSQSVLLSSTNVALATPANVNVAQGASSATFTVTAAAAASGWIVLTASYNGARKTVLITITQPAQTSSLKPGQGSTAAGGMPHLRDISCSATHLRAGVQAVCEVHFDRTVQSEPVQIELTSSTPSIRLPAAIHARIGQSTAGFRIEAAARAEGSVATVNARLADSMVQQAITLDAGGPRLGAPVRLYARPAQAVAFRVTPTESGAILSASKLPAGADFDAASGDFQWIPGVFQQGTHPITFAATGPGSDSVTARTVIEVESGAPVITRVVNAASRSEDMVCSPGAIGRIEGRWLAEQSTQLAGTTVIINGAAAPVLSASPSRVDFLCPNVAPGVDLEIALRTSVADAPPVHTVSRIVAPGLFSLDESGRGQGAIVHAGTDVVAMIPDYGYASQVALAGDALTIYATGIPAATGVKVTMGEFELGPQSIAPLPGRPGVYRIEIVVPQGLSEADVPVSLRIPMPDGSSISSNTVTVPIQNQASDRTIVPEPVL